MVWADLIFILYAALIILLSKLKDYRAVLLCNVMASLCFSSYLAVQEQYVAAAAPGCAGLLCLIQYILPIRKTRKMLLIRNFIVVVGIAFAAQFIYSEPLDLIPCITFCLVRFAEARQCTISVKLGMMTTAGIWVVFGLFTGLYLFAFLQAVLVSFFAYEFIAMHRTRSMAAASA